MNALKLLINIFGVVLIAIMPFLGLMAINLISLITAGLTAVGCSIFFIVRGGNYTAKLNFTDFAVLIFVSYGIIRSLFAEGELQWIFYFKWGALACLYFLFRFFVDRIFMYYGLILSGCAQAIVGLLQIGRVIKSSSPLFEITGSFPNPGPYAGFLAICCICALSVAVVKYKAKRIISYILVGVALFMAIMIFVADSRAAIMATLGGIMLLIFYNVRESIKKWYVIAASAVLIILVSVLYIYRKDSANGRLLIWRVSADMIYDAPLLGHGPGKFDKAYMPYQMKFFKSNPGSRFSSVAGSTKFPYNEFIHVTVECGVVGLILLLALLATIIIGKNNDILYIPVKCAIAGWCIFAFFSYPSEIFVLMAVIVILLANGGAKEISQLKHLCVTCLVVAALCGYGVYEVNKYNKKIADVRRIINMSERRMIDKDSLLRYVKSNHEWLQANQYLYDKGILSLCELGAEVNDIGQFIGYVTPSCLNYCTIGRLFVRSADYERAMEYFSNAHYMIPTMITPIYEIFKMYLAKGDYQMAEVYAVKVLEMPLKLENTKTLRIKREVEDYKSAIYNGVTYNKTKNLEETPE